jgi:recombination protein RecA
LVSQPDNGEQALEIAETLIRSNAVDVIVIDSVAALVHTELLRWRFRC